MKLKRERGGRKGVASLTDRYVWKRGRTDGLDEITDTFHTFQYHRRQQSVFLTGPKNIFHPIPLQFIRHSAIQIHTHTYIYIHVCTHTHTHATNIIITRRYDSITLSSNHFSIIGARMRRLTVICHKQSKYIHY